MDGSEIESLVSEIWSTRMNCSNINRWGDPYKSALFLCTLSIGGGAQTLSVSFGEFCHYRFLIPRGPLLLLSIGPIPSITWQLCAQKFLMICCSFNWLSGIRFYQECKKLKCWLLTYWDHICIISFGIFDCCKNEKKRPNKGAVSNVWLRRSGETYKTWYPIILRQTCSSLARQCKIGG